MMQGSLAERLRVLRARMGLSLTEAAERAGITRDTLSDLERGKRHPYMPTLHKIAGAYAVPVEDLLEEPALLGKAEAPETGQADKAAPPPWKEDEYWREQQRVEVYSEAADILEGILARFRGEFEEIRRLSGKDNLLLLAGIVMGVAGGWGLTVREQKRLAQMHGDESQRERRLRRRVDRALEELEDLTGEIYAMLREKTTSAHSSKVASIFEAPRTRRAG